MATATDLTPRKAARRALVWAALVGGVTFVLASSYIVWATWDWPRSCPPPPAIVACTPVPPGGWVEEARTFGITLAITIPGILLARRQIRRVRAHLAAAKEGES